MQDWKFSCEKRINFFHHDSLHQNDRFGVFCCSKHCHEYFEIVVPEILNFNNHIKILKAPNESSTEYVKNSWNIIILVNQMKIHFKIIYFRFFLIHCFKIMIFLFNNIDHKFERVDLIVDLIFYFIFKKIQKLNFS